MTADFQTFSRPQEVAAEPRRSVRWQMLLALLVMLSVPSLHAQERASVRKVAPIYPELAKRMKLGGTVQVTATVDSTGSVVKAESTSPIKLLVPAAVDAVKQWKFEKGDGTSTVVVAVKFDTPA